MMEPSSVEREGQINFWAEFPPAQLLLAAASSTPLPGTPAPAPPDLGQFFELRAMLTLPRSAVLTALCSRAAPVLNVHVSICCPIQT